MTEYHPIDIPTHAGQDIPDDRVFFAPPPAEIGKLLSAESSLSRTVKPPLLPAPVSTLVNLLIVGVVAGTLANYCWGVPLNPTRGAFYGLPALICFILWAQIRPLSRLFHSCSYVGEKGVAEFLLKNHRKGIVENHILLFRDARSLYFDGSDSYKSSFYRKTDFAYSWTDQNDNVLFKISGTHTGKDCAPKDLDNPYYFGVASQQAWSAHLLPVVSSALQKKQLLTFKTADITIEIKGRGIAVHKKDAITWKTEDIRSITLQKGMFTIWHTPYCDVSVFQKIITGKGLWRGRKMTLPYASLSNADMFLSVIKTIYPSAK